jgi:hypothetical protein
MQSRTPNGKERGMKTKAERVSEKIYKILAMGSDTPELFTNSQGVCKLVSIHWAKEIIAEILEREYGEGK